MKSATAEGASAIQVTTIGLDLAKQVFQVHGVDADGKAVLRKRLRRAEVLGFFEGLGSLLGRSGSLRDVPSLGARAHRARAHGQADTTRLR